LQTRACQPTNAKTQRVTDNRTAAPANQHQYEVGTSLVNKKAAKKFFRKLLKGLRYVPRVVITDQLKSYGAAKREMLPGVEHRQSRYLNNRCENSHRPTRQREYRMQGFKSAGHAQRFLSAYGPIAQHFRPRRHLWSAAEYRQEMKSRCESWAEITGTERAA
jgi:putative transposase